MDKEELITETTEEFNEKVYNALTTKLLPEIKLDEPKGISGLIGTLVLVYLLVVAGTALINSYSQKYYHQNFIEFRE